VCLYVEHRGVATPRAPSPRALLRPWEGEGDDAHTPDDVPLAARVAQRDPRGRDEAGAYVHLGTRGENGVAAERPRPLAWLWGQRGGCRTTVLCPSRECPGPGTGPRQSGAARGQRKGEASGLSPAVMQSPRRRGPRRWALAEGLAGVCGALPPAHVLLVIGYVTWLLLQWALNNRPAVKSLLRSLGLPGGILVQSHRLNDSSLGLGRVGG
jgi:hypothetical protein